MFCIIEKKDGVVQRIIGPFVAMQTAANWVALNYTKPVGTTATVEPLTKPEEAAKP